jgi:lipopolysaccharide/colanic/teichoic acid biosynthesis glycosyltransferase
MKTPSTSICPDDDNVQYSKSSHSQTGLPRLLEGVIAAIALVVFSPCLLFASLLIATSSPGPILFRQKRMGRDGRLFTLFKFRTMRVNDAGPLVTAAGDGRVMRAGRILRRTKLDELPEFWNVLIGDMSLVGARPEVPHFVDLNNVQWRQVLQSRPGLTDPVTIRLRNEEQLLATVSEPERFYLEVLQPYKLMGYVDYLNNRTWWKDLKVILKTAIAVVASSKAPPPTTEEILSYRAEILESDA